jgi:hypothetical protein
MDATNQVTRKDIEAVIKRHPLLTNYGYGLGDEALELPRDERRALHRKEQEALLGNLEQVGRAMKWWAAKEKTATTKSQKYDSYALKNNFAEAEVGYVSNGAFIAAGILCGFEVVGTGRGVNVYFNLSARSLRPCAEAETRPPRSKTV